MYMNKMNLGDVQTFHKGAGKMGKVIMHLCIMLSTWKFFTLLTYTCVCDCVHTKIYAITVNTLVSTYILLKVQLYDMTWFHQRQTARILMYVLWHKCGRYGKRILKSSTWWPKCFGYQHLIIKKNIQYIPGSSISKHGTHIHKFIKLCTIVQWYQRQIW